VRNGEGWDGGKETQCGVGINTGALEPGKGPPEHRAFLNDPSLEGGENIYSPRN